MAIHLTGAEYKAFYNDKDFWPDDNGETYYDDAALRVSGAYQPFGIDGDRLADDALVEIEGGVVFSPRAECQGLSLEEYARRWKAKLTHQTLLVQCPLENLEAIKAAITAAGGQVLTKS